MASRFKYFRVSVIAHFPTKPGSRKMTFFRDFHSGSNTRNVTGTARARGPSPCERARVMALANINKCNFPIGLQLPWVHATGATLRIPPQFFRLASQIPKDDDDLQRIKQAIKHSWQYPQKDDSGNDLIYQIRGHNMLRVCTAMFYATAFVGLYVAPDLISGTLEHDSFSRELVFNFLTIATAVVILPFLFTSFNSRLVLRLYYNKAKNSYLAVTLSPFMTLRKAAFGHRDVVPSRHKGMFFRLFSLNTLRAKGRAYYFNPYNFKIPGDFNHLMGYE